MSKAEEQALKNHTIIGFGPYEIGRLKEEFLAGYNQAEQDLMEKAKQWFMEHTNIPYKVETNEDGEPLADSYIQYAKARLDVANEMFEKFKQFITEN